jgi:hypothetical protein
MTHSQRFGVVSVIASSFVVWLYVITQVQPNKNDILMITTFFISLIVWLGSLIAYTIYSNRVRRDNREIIFAHIQPSIRQGFLISSTIAMLLFLQLIRVVTIWDAILVVLVAVLFESATRHNTGKLRR